MSEYKEWVVLRNGEVFTDRFNQEWECVEHINEEVDKGIWTREEFEHREMTDEEIKAYD